MAVQSNLTQCICTSNADIIGMCCYWFIELSGSSIACFVPALTEHYAFTYFQPQLQLLKAKDFVQQKLILKAFSKLYFFFLSSHFVHMALRNILPNIRLQERNEKFRPDKIKPLYNIQLFDLY